MKLDSLFSIFRAPVDLDTAAHEAAQDAEVLPPRRSGSPAPSDRRKESGKGEPVDTVDVSVQASYLLAASQFDPYEMSAVDMRKLAELLFENGAISAKDRDILNRGPTSGDGMRPDALLQRNYIAEFQENLATGMGRSSAQAVNDNSRALSVLGRIAAIRERML